MKKNKLLWTIAFTSLVFGGASFITSCQNDTPVNPDDDKDNPGGDDTENPGGDEGGDETPQEPTIVKSLELVKAPTKTIFTVNDYFTVDGIQVDKVTTTDGKETDRVTLQEADMNLSVAVGTQLTEVTDSLKVTLSSYSDPEAGTLTLTFTVKDYDRVQVTFENEDGTVLETDIGVIKGKGTTYDGETPTKATTDEYSYRFLGWYVKGDASETLIDLSTYVFNDDTTLVAKFAEVDLQGTDGTFTYALSGDGSGYIITEFAEVNTITSEANTVVVVPDEFNGMPVIALGDEVFSDCDDVTSITLGKNVKSVGANCFEKMGGEGLTITLNEGLETLGEATFINNTGVKSLVIPSTVKEVPYQCFYGCKNLTSIEFKEGITSLGGRLFQSTSVTNVVIPDSVTNIDPEVFYMGYTLENVTLGAGITGDQIEKTDLFSMSSSSSIWKVQVSANSTNLKTDADGLTLYSFDGKTLYGVARMGGTRDENGDLLDTTYTINDQVEHVGDNAFNYFKYGGWTKVVLGANVKTLGENAFRNNSGQVSVELNDKLEEIGTGAFYAAITSSAYPDGYELNLPDSVTTIGEQAFYNCTGLTKVTFGQNMQNFGIDCFYGCKNVTEYALNSANTYLSKDGNAFYSKDGTVLKWFANTPLEDTTFVMPNTVTEVGDGAFSNITTLTSITLSNALTKIGKQAFYKCTKLACDIVLPETLTSVGMDAFYNDSKITGVSLPGTIKEFGEGAFYNMSAAEFTGTLVIPADATLGEEVFGGCKKLTTMKVETTTLTKNLFYNCQGLTSVELAEGTTEIPENCFYNATGLETCTLPSTITAIRKQAFRNTPKLTSQVFTDKLTTLEDNCYYQSGLTSVVIPASVTTFGESVFSNNVDLASVVFEGSLEVLPVNTFYKTTSLKSITWPSGLKEIDASCFKYAGFEELTIPEGVTTFADNVFSYCSELKTVTLPNSLTDLGTSTFYSDSALTTVNFGTGVKEFKGSNFANCTSLDMSKVPAGVTTLYYGIYYGSGLTEFTLDDGITFSDNGTSMFQNCKSLAKFTWNDTAETTIGSNFFNGCSALTDFTVGENVKISVIDSSAFRSSGITKTPFDLSSVKEIGTYAFSACKSLTEFELPANAEYTLLDDYTFYQCTALQTLTIPANVTEVGKYVAQGDSQLATLNIENPNLKVGSAVSTSSAPFRNCTALSTINFSGTREQAEALFTTTFFGTTNIAVTINCLADGSSYTYTK